LLCVRWERDGLRQAMPQAGSFLPDTDHRQAAAGARRVDHALDQSGLGAGVRLAVDPGAGQVSLEPGVLVTVGRVPAQMIPQ
jgi:hypothetical protein